MTNEEVQKAFLNYWRETLEEYPELMHDKPAKNMHFGIFTDTLCRSGAITMQQFQELEEPEFDEYA